MAVKEVDMSDDHQLINQAKAGSHAAFDLLVLKYQHQVRQLFRRYLHDKSEIADLTQETFIKAFRALENFREDSHFYTWLYRIAINTMKNYLVSKQRDEQNLVEVDNELLEDLTDAELADEATPEGLLARDRLADLVFSSVNALSYELRTALILRELEGFSYEEIAGIMDCPVGTVRSRIFRARQVVNDDLRQKTGQGFTGFTD